MSEAGPTESRVGTSAPPRIALVGATGLVGRRIMEAAVGREDLRLFAIARNEAPLPPGARMEMFVAETDRWAEVLEAQAPDALICALGTTWRKAGREEDAFRAVDHDLVLDVARAAKAAGTKRMVAVSSVGADPQARSFYLRVKGEVEQALAKLKIGRLDILRPGLLRGPRSGDRRALERLGILASPLTDLALHGRARRYRSIDARIVARAALALALRKADGRFVHEGPAIHRAARELAAIEREIAGKPG